MTEVETYSYDDDGKVEAETVIKTEDAEYVVVETEGIDKHSVYERNPGETEPHTVLAE